MDGRLIFLHSARRLKQRDGLLDWSRVIGFTHRKVEAHLIAESKKEVSRNSVC